MNKSESISKLAPALVKATAKIKAVKMDAENPYYHSKYATLGALIDVAKPVCAEFGLSTPAFMVSEAGQVGIEQWIIHESGEYISDRILLPLPEESKIRVAQEMGATVSYLRRYALSALLGMYADEDGDGEPRSGTADKLKTVARTEEAKVAATIKKEYKQAPIPEKTEGRPYQPGELLIKLQTTADKVPPASDAQLKLCSRILHEQFETDEIRHAFYEYIFGVTSMKDADLKMVNAVLKWLAIGEDWKPSKLAQDEIALVMEEVLA